MAVFLIPNMNAAINNALFVHRLSARQLIIFLSCSIFNFIVEQQVQCYFLYPSKLLASGPSFPFYLFLGSLMCPTPISATPGVFYASQSPLLLSLVLSPWQYVLSFRVSKFPPLLSQINNASLSQIRILTSYCMYAHGTYTGLMVGYWLG